MTSKKKDLEIVYNLQWKNKPVIGDEKSNMVGMYDIPATTLNWDSFKSYLLKNSGTAGDDVKVSYISSNDQEVTIDSQLDFQVALYTFRQKARLSEIITLKLDRIVDKKSNSGSSIIKKMVQSADFQVQVENDQLRASSFSDGPPDWFTKYMKKFKEEVIEEISTAFNATKLPNVSQAGIYHPRKSKVESYKRCRKTNLLLGDINNDKEVVKSAKLERKLENKLEKLEHKTMKIKAKKMALRVSSDSDVGRGSIKSRPIGLPPSDSELLMNASAVSQYETVIPHMSGGETYLQKWEVTNSGKLPWTAETELRYAWGSQAFTPVDKRVPCPHLNPGEKGTVAVLLDIPIFPGSFECYWHFHHNGRRFGHWLGCQVIVDEPAVNDKPYEVIRIQDMYESLWSSTSKKAKMEDCNSSNIEESPMCDNSKNKTEESESGKFSTCFPVDLSKSQTEEMPKDKNEANLDEYKSALENINNSLQDLKIRPNTASDSDNQSIISISDSNTSVNSVSSEDFVLVPVSHTDENVCGETEHNILQKIATAENSQKFNIGSVPAHLDKLLLNVSRDSSREETWGEVTVGDNVETHRHESDSNNNTEKLSNNYGVSCTAVQENLPMDLSNKCDDILPTKEDDCGKSKAEYAYIYFNGQKIPIAKEYLRADYLETAEEVCESKDCPAKAFAEDVKSVRSDEMSNNIMDSVQKMSQSEYVSLDSAFNDSHCSAAGSTFSDKTNGHMNPKRFFVFPQNCPGYEVVNLSRNMSPQNNLSRNMSPQSYVQGELDSHNTSYSAVTANPQYDVNNSQYSPNSAFHQYNLNNCQYNPNDMPKEVLINDWATGQNYPPNNSQYGNYNPFVKTGYNYESTPNDIYGENPYVQRPLNLVNHIGFESQNIPDGKCPYQVNEHILAGCNPTVCKLQQSTEQNSSKSDAHTSSNNSTRSHSSHSTSSQTFRNRPPIKCSSSVQSVPDNLLAGAAIAATSAMNTARSVLNMFVTSKNSHVGRWENGHWVSTNPKSEREKSLNTLHEMGFLDRDLNATLLARYSDDVNRVVFELIQ